MTVKFGRLPEGEFNDFGCDFANLTFCGPPAGKYRRQLLVQRTDCAVGSLGRQCRLPHRRLRDESAGPRPELLAGMVLLRYRSHVHAELGWSLAIIAITFAASAAVLLSMSWKARPWLVWNATASTPIGLYRVHRTDTFAEAT
jgi:hypothetical protein